VSSKIVEQHIPCPFCTSSDAYCTYDDGHGYCFSCNTFKPPKEDFIVDNFTYEYIPLRGLDRGTLEFYNIRTKCDTSGKPVELGFTYPSGFTKVRSLDHKEFWTVGDSKPELFGFDKFAHGAHKTITITEGELDAASIYQVTRTPCVSVRSASSAVVDIGSVRQQLAAYERIYLAFDGDAIGRDATARVAKLFEHGKVYDIRFTHRKDANEFLQHGEGNDLLNLWHNARVYQPDNIVSDLNDFRSIINTPDQKGVPYPFPTLTKMTYGIRMGETVLIKAPEKVGKTALMHAIEHHLLKETDDNVAAIYLEEPKLRHLQALAGLELGRPVHLPDSGCSNDEVFSAIQHLVKKDGRLHIYSHFGSDDADVLCDTIRFLVVALGCRYVLFDHITMACSVLSGRDDERRQLESLATKLEMMVKELNFSLIMVSHVNDFGQTRGSHYLTKVADITISAERNTLSLDERERRTIHLSIPFNRFCSQTGPAGDIIFNPETYRLTEVNDNERHLNVSEEVRVYNNPANDNWREVDAGELRLNQPLRAA
jgi:KaiC/GvpD/RAD55 family RecA-like ATPase